MNRDHDDKVIRHMYDTIETPDYDVTKDVMKQIRPATRGRVVLKRVVIAAAILCVCFTFLAAVKIIPWQTFNLFGEKVGESELIAATPVPQQCEDPWTDEDEQFLDEVKLGETRAITVANGGSGRTGRAETDDFATIESYVSNSDTPMMLPSYVPEGYVFTKGTVEFYLDMESLQSELIASEEMDGKRYEVYQLPDEYDKKIEWLTLYYTGEDGDELRYEVHLMEAIDDGCSYEHGAPESAVVKRLNIEGFDTGILIHDAEKANEKLNIAVVYKEVAPFNVLFSLIGVMDHPESAEHSCHEYGAMTIRVVTEILCKEEVINIVESIQEARR